MRRLLAGRSHSNSSPAPPLPSPPVSSSEDEDSREGDARFLLARSPAPLSTVVEDDEGKKEHESKRICSMDIAQDKARASPLGSCMSRAVTNCGPSPPPSLPLLQSVKCKP